MKTKKKTPRCVKEDEEDKKDQGETNTHTKRKKHNRKNNEKKSVHTYLFLGFATQHRT